MKKCLTLALAAVLLLTACGCGRYSSKYFAVGFVHSNEALNAFMSFHSFEGTMVFKLSAGNGKIRYSAELEEESATVYYDTGGFFFSANGIALDDGMILKITGDDRQALKAEVTSPGGTVTGEYELFSARL